MIKLIGRKRFIILVSVLMVNIILAAFWFLWIEPSRIDAENRLSSLNSQISTLQNDIATIKDQIAETEKNIPHYNRLAEMGFFDDQDRFNAERLIHNIQNNSGVRSASFSIDELIDVNEPLAREAKHRLVMSPIEIKDIQAYNDIEVYKLLYLLNNSFTGHTRLKSFSMSRPLVITEADLDKLSDPEKAKAFVSATAVFEWYTMLEIPPEDVPGVGGGF